MRVDIIFKIAAIGILITVITQVLKKSDRDDIATLVALAGLVIVLTLVINMISDLFTNIKNIFNLYSNNNSSIYIFLSSSVRNDSIRRIY